MHIGDVCQLEKRVNSFKEKLQSQQHNMAGQSTWFYEMRGVRAPETTLVSSPWRDEKTTTRL